MRRSTLTLLALAFFIGTAFVAQDALALGRGRTGQSGGTPLGLIADGGGGGGSGETGGSGAPEPATMLLLAAGSGIAGIKYLRRRKSSSNE